MSDELIVGLILATMPIWILILGVPTLYIIDYITDEL